MTCLAGAVWGTFSEDFGLSGVVGHSTTRSSPTVLLRARFLVGCLFEVPSFDPSVFSVSFSSALSLSVSVDSSLLLVGFELDFDSRPDFRELSFSDALSDLLSSLDSESGSTRFQR
jgi:hypothetical protein